MSTKPSAIPPPSPDFVRLPDPPEPEDMYNHLFMGIPGYLAALVSHVGNEDTTLISSELYVSPTLTSRQSEMLVPDLIIALNVDPAACLARNGYVIEEQGKPPDLALEIGSATTGRRDLTVKRDGYASFGIPEYWRFDHSGGNFHGAPLAGDRLVDGVYQPIEIVETDPDNYWGRSAVLNLNLCWESGQLLWYDPAGQRYLSSYKEVEAERDEALARVRQLEEELRQHGHPSS